jgi:hypothetical protein
MGARGICAEHYEERLWTSVWTELSTEYARGFRYMSREFEHQDGDEKLRSVSDWSPLSKH